MKLLPPLAFDGPEGLRVDVSPEGDAVLRAPEPHGAQLVPERAVALAFALLELYAPELLDAFEREVRAQRLRVVAGPEDAA